MVAELAEILPKLKETPRRHFTDDDLLQVAVKVARTGCSESEACVSMGLRPDCYFTFKSRAKRDVRYSNILTRARELMVDGLLNQMETVGAKDWRMYNERLIHIAPQRFSDRQQQPQAAPTAININLISTTLEKVYAQVIAQQPVRQITQVSTNDTQLNDSTASG